jgi:hypothetical protein
MILNERAKFDLAVRLRCEGAPLSEVFSFVSGLYFRGKIAYSSRFGSAPAGVAACFVITPNRGLIPADTIVTLPELHEMAAVPVDAGEVRYRIPLEAEARRLAQAAGSSSVFVLLGSVATAKYVDPLLQVFGQRLLFPADFVGRGDMSRGGLLLRCARGGVELSYVPVRGSVRHGVRPPKLPKLHNGSEAVLGSYTVSPRIDKRFNTEGNENKA